MKLYSCEVRHSGNREHTIPKFNVTPKELVLLKRMHGDDSVVNVVETGETDMTEEIELFRLCRAYKRGRVEKHLTVSVPNYDAWLEREIDREAEDRDARERARRKREQIRRTQENVTDAVHAAIEAGLMAPPPAPVTTGRGKSSQV